MAVKARLTGGSILFLRRCFRFALGFAFLVGLGIDYPISRATAKAEPHDRDQKRRQRARCSLSDCPRHDTSCLQTDARRAARLGDRLPSLGRGRERELRDPTSGSECDPSTMRACRRSFPPRDRKTRSKPFAVLTGVAWAHRRHDRTPAIGRLGIERFSVERRSPTRRPGRS